MKRHIFIAGLLLSAAAQLPFPSTNADAANVRRHLRCESLALPIVTFSGPSTIWSLRITNSWSLTIPKGTTYTVTVDRRSSTFKSGAALGPGQQTMYGGYNSKPQSCSVTVPG